MNLVLERKNQPDETRDVGGIMQMTPPIDESYWEYRVMVSEKQAIVGFPKFGTVGVGFMLEDDWNSNLPCRICTAEEIFDHIKHNKGDNAISDDDCLQAIRMIRDAVAEDRGWGTVEEEKEHGPR